MARLFRIRSVVLLPVALCAACATAPRGEVEPAAPLPQASAQPEDPATSRRLADLALRAMGYLGVSYRYGGSDPQHGFDCSGFVRYVFNEALGVTLPRRSEEMGRIGERVDARALRPGDLVFFNTLRRAYSHVGIYLGEDKFIHAPAHGGEVRIENMKERYWARRFDGARRITGA